MQHLVSEQDILAADENSPLSPSPVFDNIFPYKIMGRGTPYPSVVVDFSLDGESAHKSFSVPDVHFEIAKRNFVGASTTAAEIILGDLLNARKRCA